jgi:single-stranded DNA-binding protein
MSTAMTTITGKIRKMEEIDVNGVYLLKISIPTYSREGGEKHTTWWQACVWARRGLAAQRVLQVGDLVSVTGNAKVCMFESDEGKTSYQAEIECVAWARIDRGE